MRAGRLTPALLLVVAVPSFVSAGPITVDFDDLSDLDVVTAQYSGLAFSNTIVLAAGVTLNEFEFPPHSDFNVASDDSGPIGIVFSTPMASFSGYFTYLMPLTLTAYDAFDTPLTSVASAFFSNLALSGDQASMPNEFLQLLWAPGITKVVIEGDSAGGSFTMDDLTATPVPEPATLLLLTVGGAGLALKRRRARR